MNVPYFILMSAMWTACVLNTYSFILNHRRFKRLTELEAQATNLLAEMRKTQVKLDTALAEAKKL